MGGGIPPAMLRNILITAHCGNFMNAATQHCDLLSPGVTHTPVFHVSRPRCVARIFFSALLATGTGGDSTHIFHTSNWLREFSIGAPIFTSRLRCFVVVLLIFCSYTLGRLIQVRISPEWFLLFQHVINSALWVFHRIFVLR